jgi:hypothetical protein
MKTDVLDPACNNGHHELSLKHQIYKAFVRSILLTLPATWLEAFLELVARHDCAEV